MKVIVEYWEADEYVICITDPDIGLIGSTYHKSEANKIAGFLNTFGIK
jgi:hypothetical protein